MNRAQRRRKLKAKKSAIKAAKAQRNLARREYSAMMQNEINRQYHELWMEANESREEQLIDKLKRYGGVVKGWF